MSDDTLIASTTIYMLSLHKLDKTYVATKKKSTQFECFQKPLPLHTTETQCSHLFFASQFQVHGFK